MYEEEFWESIPGFSKYEVSSLGRVRHHDRRTPRKPELSKPGGRPCLMLYPDDWRERPRRRQINVLVAEAFLDPSQYPDETAIWHKDGDLLNCRASNLKWETRRHVLEWVRMHKEGVPQYQTPRIKNNRTGVVYANAFECGMAEGETESKILWRLEGNAEIYDVNAKYTYIL